MKRCIFLKQEYVEPGQLKKPELAAAKDNQFKQTVLLFKSQMKEISKSFKILKELSPEAVVIEYADDLQDKMYEMLCAADIVQTIDSILPAETK